MVRRISDRQLAQVRRLRREMTRAETILWRGLSDRGIGAKFRRQVPIGCYVAAATKSDVPIQYPTKTFDCADAPNIIHTKVVNAKINGTTL